MLSLKQKNIFPTISMVIVNCLYIFFYIFNGNSSLVESLNSVQLKNISFPSVFFILTLTINSLVSRETKAMLIFWRTKNIMPGHFAFTIHMQNDSRINEAILIEKYGPLPIEPQEQNRLWYKIYRDVGDSKQIEQIHKHFLLFRDFFFVMLVILIFTFIILLILDSQAIKLRYLYFIPLIIQVLLFMLAARVSGVSFVKNVLAEATIKWGN